MLPKYTENVQIPVGQKYNYLTVLGYSHKDSHGKSWWMFRCDCGKAKNIRAGQVVKGLVKSCGCLPRYRNLKRKQESIKRDTIIYQRVMVEKKTYAVTAKELGISRNAVSGAVWRMRNRGVRNER